MKIQKKKLGGGGGRVRGCRVRGGLGWWGGSGWM